VALPFPFAVTTRTSRLLAIAIAALSLSACDGLLDFDCGVVARTVANGVVRDPAGASLATVQVDLSENVGPALLRLSAGVMGPANSAGAPLKGRVTAARLVTETGELIAEIPTGTATLYLDVVVALNKDFASKEEYMRVRDMLLTTRAKVILETDLPGLARIETTLNDARDLPGDVQQCSYS
jgi:hypothetical protein